jgi:hypothetical protein
MRSHAPWPQMVIATVLVMVVPAAVVWALSASGAIRSILAGVERVKAAGAVHDIGKLRVAADVLYKPGRLTDAVVRADCKHGGWEALGYPNQGQCIADAVKP